MSKADELWEKYLAPVLPDGVLRVAFSDALREYGEHVKAEAVKVCFAEKGRQVMSKYATVRECDNARRIADNCAEAIKTMELK